MTNNHSMTYAGFNKTKAQTDHLRAIPLESILRLYGAQQDHHDKAKWHTDQGAISITEPKFFNWHNNAGGGGAIDLAMHLHHFSFKEALTWLAANFHSTTTTTTYAQTSLPTPLKLPPQAPENLFRVRDYLVNQRAIASDVLKPLLQNQTVYADSRANAVFVLLDGDSPVGAELRGTSHITWHGMAPGSLRDLGFFSVGACSLSSKIILCESAIDAISCSILNPQYRCFSTAGARPNAAWLPSLLKRFEVFCGFDIDVTGERMAQQMISLYPAIKRLRPTLHDWNDVLKAQPRSTHPSDVDF